MRGVEQRVAGLGSTLFAALVGGLLPGTLVWRRPGFLLQLGSALRASWTSVPMPTLSGGEVR